MITRASLEAHPAEAAPALLGARLVSDVGTRTILRITEVEAYAPDDPASHSFGGLNRRNRSMFEIAGTLYVYRSYGIHWCANVVTGRSGDGAAVLIRAGVPREGAGVMTERRRRSTHLADGPGKLCQAMAIDGAFDGVDLLDPSSPVRLEPGTAPTRFEITPRVGITKAVDTEWRFVSLDD